MRSNSIIFDGSGSINLTHRAIERSTIIVDVSPDINHRGQIQDEGLKLDRGSDAGLFGGNGEDL